MQRLLGKAIFGFLLMFIVFLIWALGLFWAPQESHQGEVYRILYLHVPSAFAAFLSAFVLFIASLIGLKRGVEPLHWAKSSAEIGLMFTCLTLVTGSIWGKPTWGTWWTWDARLTTTFILGLLFVGYILLFNSVDQPALKRKVCSILGILIFMDVPIIYKSVTWWRTLHQPPSLMRAEGATMSSPIFWSLLASILATQVLVLWFIFKRKQILSLKESIDSMTYEKLGEQEAYQAPQ